MMGLPTDILFAHPWVLLGLAALPAIWLLLRAVPPAPARIVFPPARLIFDMMRTEETAARTPWWLLLLRLLIAVLVIVALARPVLNPGARFTGDGPVVLLLDDGWAAADDWDSLTASLTEIVQRAERQARPVVLLRTARPADGTDPAMVAYTAEEMRSRIDGMMPKPWAPDRAAAARAIRDWQRSPADDLGSGLANVFWLTDGLIAGADDGADQTFVDAARSLGELTVLFPTEGRQPLLLRPAFSVGSDVEIAVERAAAGTALPVTLRATSEDGRVLLRRTVQFDADATRLEWRETLPLEAMNAIRRIAIEGREGAGTTALTDTSLRRFRVGVSGTRAPERAQPLLSDHYYLQRALDPFADVVVGEIGDLLSSPLSILMLPDVGRLVEADRIRLQDWLEKGGVLVRFAGPRLAEHGDTLLPVQLRRGNRTLQGTMSWAEPARLAPFPAESPFAGLAIPDDVRVNRQVLAEPSLDLADKTWSRLTDGTPMVTAEHRGKGWLVLIHTTANTAWSNLPLSGLFVDMLRRLTAMSAGIDPGAEADVSLPPRMVLDGFGRLKAPGPAVQAIGSTGLAEQVATPLTPPGLYGEEGAALALNLGTAAPAPQPLPALPLGVTTGRTGASPEQDLGPWLLTAALILLIADLIAGLALRGMLRPRLARRSTVGGLLAPMLGTMALFGLLALSDARAQDAARSGNADGSGGDRVPTEVIEATLDTRFAYVLTGSTAIDRMSAAGVSGLSEIMRARTSVEPLSPVGIDIEEDELIFFPFVYWPMTEDQPTLSDDAVKRLDRYLRTGGVILFDTRDAGAAVFGRDRTGPGTRRLRQLLSRIDIGPLEVVREGHVLTRSFYLSDQFPGRYTGGRVWVERLDARDNDGVSPLVIGDADWAAAWAMDDAGRPIAKLTPGGRRQRELAYRFGINLVMYALTGSYKSDQVHLPAILDRLGQ